MAGEQQSQYTIGQVIYILSNKSQAVVPAIITEEDCRKVRKLDGVHEVVNYKLSIGPKERQRVVNLSEIDGEVFFSLEDIRVHLTQRLTAFVDNLVQTTLKNAQKWYGVTADNQILGPTLGESRSEFKLDPGDIVNAVNNNVPLQTSGHHPLHLNNSPSPVNPHITMRENIKNMVTPGSEEDPMNGLGLNQPELRTVILPDGTRAQLKQG